MADNITSTKYTLRGFQKHYQEWSRGENVEKKHIDDNAEHKSKRSNRNHGKSRFKTTDYIANESFKEEEKSKTMQRLTRFSVKSRKDHTLLSRGGGDELKLNRHNERETFFIKIKRDFLEYCSDSETDLKTDISRFATGKDMKNQQEQNRNKIDAILLDLRKLREVLLSSKPTEFTLRVYLYSTKVGAMLLHHQTYMHCIDYLISNIVESKTCQVKLTDVELEEITSIYILHLAHFNLEAQERSHINNASNLSKCFELYNKYIPKNRVIKDILRSIVDSNYLLWFQSYKVLRANIIYKIILEKYGLNSIISSMINVLNSAYYRLSKCYLEDTILSQCITFEYLHNNFEQCKLWKSNQDQIILRDRNSKK